MKKLTLFVIVVSILTNCKQKSVDLTKIRWQPLETALSVYFQKDGEGHTKKQEIAFVGYLDETKHAIIDSSVTKNFIGFALPSVQALLQEKLPRFICKNSEGYLKLSLYDLAISSAKVDVYLNDKIKYQERIRYYRSSTNGRK